MFPCSLCGENNWNMNKGLIKSLGLIYANCNVCGNEISFEVQQSSNLNFRVGDNCPDRCGGSLYLKESKKTKTKSRNYFYLAYYLCDNCKKIYFSDRFKVYYYTDKIEPNKIYAKNKPMFK